MKSWSIFLKIGFDFPGGPVVKTANPLQRAWVRSLVWELRKTLHAAWRDQNKERKKSSKKGGKNSLSGQ